MTAILVALAVAGGVGDRLRPTQVEFDVIVCKGDPLGSKAQGTVKHIAEPRITAFNGRSVSFLMGTPGSDAGAKDRWLPFSFQVEFLPIRYPNGSIWIEVSTTYRETCPALVFLGLPGFVEQSRRQSRFVKSGEKFRFRIAADSPDSQTWAEVTVIELPSQK